MHGVDPVIDDSENHRGAKPDISVHRSSAELGVARALNPIRRCGVFHYLSLVLPQLLLAALPIAVNSNGGRL